jgi:hypothetical protein
MNVTLPLDKLDDNDLSTLADIVEELGAPTNDPGQHVTAVLLTPVIVAVRDEVSGRRAGPTEPTVIQLVGLEEVRASELMALQRVVNDFVSGVAICGGQAWVALTPLAAALREQIQRREL